MKHYIDKNKQVHGIGEASDIDGDQSFLVQDSWTLLTDEEFQAIINPPMTLEQAKEVQLSLLSDVFNTESNLPVTVGKNTYTGGYDSAGKLNGALSLASAMSQSIVTFFDINNLPIELPLADALTVITTIGTKFQSDFAKFQAYKVSINNSTSVAEIQSIVWSN